MLDFWPVTVVALKMLERKIAEVKGKVCRPRVKTVGK